MSLDARYGTQGKTGIFMESRKHIYYLTVEDVQTVAQEAIGHKLRKKELQKVVDKIADKIQWYDVIEEVISQEIRTH
jgi:hypothetical protein